MKVAMITTFFGEHSFGGDAAYVDRLARALLRRGHDVHVIYCYDAWNTVRGDHPPRPYDPPPGLHIHPLRSRFGALSPIATQASGRPWFKTRELKRILGTARADVVHFHNISLVGGPEVLDMERRAVRLMTAHEHWLTCPMHLLWKFDREPCEKRECVRCSIAGRRPPQIWRSTGLIARNLVRLDAVMFPSRHALQSHKRRGISGPPLLHLPYFLPDDWSQEAIDSPDSPPSKPYLAAAGRLVRMKGFERLISIMRNFPEVELRIAGTGPIEGELKRQAAGLSNVRFEGLLGGVELARLFQGARAVVVPSLFPETFGYVVLEAFAVGTPVIVHRGGGALEETGVESGGGLGYRSDAEFSEAIQRLVEDDDLHDRLSTRGRQARWGEWSEKSHMHMYESMIERILDARALGKTWRPCTDTLLELTRVDRQHDAA
jgi:glycosyltransferase involved in cell wall biosynthesis